MTGTVYDDLADPEATIPAGDLDLSTTLRDRLPAQFQDGENWILLAETIAEALQPIEAFLAAVLAATDVATCGPDALAKLGRFVGAPRGSLTSEQYRVAVQVYGAALTASGTRSEIMSLLRQLFPDGDVDVLELYPAALDAAIDAPGLDLGIAALVGDLLNREGGGVVAAGVGVGVVAADSDLVGGWASDAGPPPDPDMVGVWASDTAGPPDPDDGESLWAASV